MQYTAKQSNLAKGTVDYLVTTTQHAANEAAGKFGNAFDSFTVFDAGTKKVTAIYISTGTAFISY
jgi:hypothetical protein